MESKFNIVPLQKKGASANKSMDTLILIVIILILVSQLAPIALTGLFNETVFNNTQVPSFVPGTLGLLGVIAFIYIIWRVAKGGK